MTMGVTYPVVYLSDLDFWAVGEVEWPPTSFSDVESIVTNL